MSAKGSGNTTRKSTATASRKSKSKGTGKSRSANKPKPAFSVRLGQREFERGAERYRLTGFVARRQYGKTTIAARIALKKMMRTAGHTVIFGSAKLDLGREIVRKEAAQIQSALGALAEAATQSKAKFDVTESGRDRSLLALDADAFADIFEHSRLEFRLYHSSSVYSRTKVVAVTPDAVGETGDLILDEIRAAKRFQDVWEAMHPIIAGNRQFRAILTTTPPVDDTHFGFALLSPPIDAAFTPNPAGTWYRSEFGVRVLRLDAYDAAADGVPLYDDDTGEPLTPEESRRRAPDKDAWDRNYGCKFLVGGTACCGLTELDIAQRRGLGQGTCVVVDDDHSFDQALEFLTRHLGNGPIAGGWDLASTEKATSNPSSFTVMELDGSDFVTRLALLWKTSRPEVQIERARKLIAAVAARPAGGRMRRLGIDATGDRLFARGVQQALAGDVPVELIVMSETVQLPGYDSTVTRKTALHDRYLGALNDNRHTFPPERYFREDHRLLKKVGGTYTCEAGPDGRHGDTFTSGALALEMLTSNAGALTPEATTQIRLAPARWRPTLLTQGGRLA